MESIGMQLNPSQCKRTPYNVKACLLQKQLCSITHTDRQKTDFLSTINETCPIDSAHYALSLPSSGM